MVEQIRISPEEVRGYGNICEGHTLEDFIVSNSGLAKEKENVHGALTSVYRLVYSLYGLIFSFDKGNKQLYLQMAEADTLSFGFDTVNKQLYLVDENDTGFNLGFDEDTNELYITDDAPPIVHDYSLAFSAASYVATGGSATLECTLLDNNVPVEGATISVSGSDSSLYTGITNNNGVATVTVSVSAETTFTASYSNVSDTCTVTVQTETILWQPSLDGTDGYTNYNSSTGSSCTTQNGELTGRNIKFNSTWSNSVDWELTLDAKTSDIYMGFSVMKSDITQIDRYCLQFLQTDTLPSVGVNYKATTSGTTVAVSDKSLVNTYRAIKIRKESGVYSIYIEGDLVKTYNKTDSWTNVCLTLYTWESNRTMTIKNVKVIQLEQKLYNASTL